MDETTLAQAGDDMELTEMELMDVRRVSGVPQGANGFPHLMLKGLAAKANNPEAPSAAEPEPAHQAWTGTHMHLHPAFDGPDGNGDDLHQHVHTHDNDNDHGHMHDGRDPDHDGDDDSTAAGDTDHDYVEPDGSPGPKAAKAALDLAEMELVGADEDAVAKDSRTFTAAERKRNADSGNALPDGSYPIPDADALRRAAILARSKHGNWQAARRLIARRAKELGVSNPLDEDDTDASASKGVALAEGEASVQDDAQGSDALTKAVADAVTKATGPLKAEIESLRADLAKVKATPIPGGPVLSSAARPIGAVSEDGENWVAKAALYRAKADAATSPADREGYRQLARQADEKAAKAAATT